MKEIFVVVETTEDGHLIDAPYFADWNGIQLEAIRAFEKQSDAEELARARANSYLEYLVYRGYDTAFIKENVDPPLFISVEGVADEYIMRWQIRKIAIK